MLELETGEVDAALFEELARSGHARVDEGDLDAARWRLTEAARLWRGRPFGDMADHPALVADVARLSEEQVAVAERLLEVRLRAGEHVEVISELEAFVARHPLRERAWGLLLEALRRSGRQADALAAYQRLRDRIATALGTEPGPELQSLYETILRSDPATSSAPDRPARAEQSSRASPSWQCRRELPLVGRDRQLADLRTIYDRVREGQTQVVLLCGEAGIGKTRLVAEFADAAACEGAAVLAGGCSIDSSVPYQPFIEALRADVEATPRQRLVERLGRGAKELVRLLPDLAHRIDLPAPTPAISMELDQHRLFEAVCAWLGAASLDRPLLLVIEDVHAANRPTLLLLRHVLNAAPTGRLLLVVTYRDTGEELSAALADAVGELTNRPGVAELQLAGLDQAAVGDLVAARLPDVPHRERWAMAVQAATGGNPLFVEEVLAAVGGDRHGDPDHLLEAPIAPRGVRHLLETRIRRLSPATIGLLEQAAVAGDRFEFATISRAAELGENEALDALAEATAARLIGATGSHGDQYRFAHAVMRAALLDRITPSRRMRLHARLAAELETLEGTDSEVVPGVIAYHYAAAGPVADATRALGYARAAADAAMAQCAYDEAVAHYEHGLSLLGPADDQSERCELITRLGQAQARAGRSEHQATLARAARLAIALGDPERIAEAAMAASRGFFSNVGAVDDQRVGLLHDALEVVSSEHPGPRAQLLALLGSEVVFTGDLSRRRELTDEALRLARRQTDPTVLGRVLALRAMTIQHPATLDERLAETAELIELARRLADPVVETLAHMWRFLAALEIGDRGEADAALDHARRLSEDALDHPIVQVFLTSMDAARELLWGDLDRAEQLAERYRTLGRDAGVHDVDSPYLAHRFVLHRERGTLWEYLPLVERAVDAYGMVPAWQAAAALVWWLTGHHDRALSVLDRYAADDFASVPRDHLWTDALCLFAEVASLAGRRGAARRLLALLTPYHDRLTAEPAVPLGAVAHYLGLLATSLEDWEAAHRYFHEAAELHDKIGAARWHIRTLLANARMHQLRDLPGDDDAAAQLLQAAADRARQAGQHALFSRLAATR